MVALPGDVTRSSEGAKIAFETIFKAMVSVLEQGIGGRKRHRDAQAIAAMCVGGMVVARAMDDCAVADELRTSCMTVAFELGGWERVAAAKNGRKRRVSVGR